MKTTSIFLTFVCYTTNAFKINDIIDLGKISSQCIPDTFKCSAEGGIDGVGCCSGICEVFSEGNYFCKRSETLFATAINAKESREKYNDFLSLGISYHQKYEHVHKLTLSHEEKFQTYLENQIIVNQLNSIMDGNVFDLNENPFADMRPEHFRKYVLLKEHEPSVDISNENEEVDLSNVPDTLDWNAKGAVTEVKNQGFLGSCWAFSACGNIEGLYAIKTGKLESLSVEQLIECDGNSDKSRKIADCGEFGGWPYMAFEYIKKQGGIFSDKKFDYCSGITNPKTKMPYCLPCMANRYSKAYCGDHGDLYCNASTTLGQGESDLCHAKNGFVTKVSGYRSISSNEDVMAKEMASVGPLSVAMNAMPLQFYKRGVFDPPSWLCSPELDHAVLAVGYGEEEVKGYFPWSKTTLKKYWKVKNSWGASWAEEGFFKIKRGQGTCGINTSVVTAIL